MQLNEIYVLTKDMPYGGFKKGDKVRVTNIMEFHNTGVTYATFSKCGTPDVATFLIGHSYV